MTGSSLIAFLSQLGTLKLDFHWGSIWAEPLVIMIDSGFLVKKKSLEEKYSKLHSMKCLETFWRVWLTAFC